MKLPPFAFWLALLVAAVVEISLVGQVPGLGWLVFCLAFLAAVETFRVRLERKAPLWTAGLWLAPLSFSLSILSLDSEVVRHWGPVLAGIGMVMAAHWRLAGHSPFEGLARLMPNPYDLIPGRWVVDTVLAAQDLPKPGPDGGQAMGKVGRGLLMAAPLLAIFTWLLASADPIFGSRLTQLLQLGFGQSWTTVVRIVLFTLACMGLFRLLAFRLEPVEAPLEPDNARDEVEVSTALASLNLLFGAFLAVQAHYLFGGVEHLAAWNLNYADYARHGFFELATCTILVFVVAGLAYRWSYRGPRPGWPLALVALLVAQTFGLAGSAIFRLQLYIQEFGLSVLRFYAAAGVVTMCLLLAVILVASLSRKPFAWVVARQVVAAMAVLALVGSVRVDSLVVSTHLDRLRHGQKTIDIEYLGRLSTDAIPLLEKATADPDPEVRQAAGLIAGRILDRRPTDAWQSWNLSRARSRQGKLAKTRREAASGGTDGRNQASRAVQTRSGLLRENRAGEGGSRTQADLSLVRDERRAQVADPL
ncbi:MAG: DUF4153 domain-containing protein [Vulcanimicrobiota bacterium]